jgi:YegS/Rv2252/BmrU family lipid kinase
VKKRILFIINPISGGKDKTVLPKEIDKYLDRDKFEASFVMTKGGGHAYEVAREAVDEGIHVIVAVGGDGTINEVASAIKGTASSIGIIPCGSGNGLARALRIPLDVKHAVKKLNEEHVETIDSGELNGRRFFNMAGLGFDAQICVRFAEDTARGFLGYVRTAFSEIRKYRSQQYEIEIDGRRFKRDAFMISLANSSQFGNNAHVSPHASVVDGLLDVCIIKPFPLYHFPVMGYHMFTKTADRSRYVEIIRGRYVKIRRKTKGPVHVDGEPVIMGPDLDIALEPKSLNVLV